jgi:hypothetical protein
VNNRIWFYVGNRIQHAPSVSNIQIMVVKSLKCSLQSVAVPRSVSLWPEEIFAHVVIDTVHGPTFPAEKCHDFASNEAA